MNDTDALYQLNELQRRIACLIKAGTIVSVNIQDAKASVKIGNLTTCELPWITSKAGSDATWFAPEIGEQVLVLSACGDLNNGVILGAIYQERFKAPSQLPQEHKLQYADGTTVVYDKDTHRLQIDSTGDIIISSAKSIHVETPNTKITATLAITGDVTLSGNLTVNGAITASGDILAAGSNSNHHTHV